MQKLFEFSTRKLQPVNAYEEEIQKKIFGSISIVKYIFGICFYTGKMCVPLFVCVLMALSEP